MSGFDSDLLAARQAQETAWEAGVRLDAAYEARGRAVARAWANRPGGTTWDDFVTAFNRGLPEAARLKVSVLRLDEQRYREPAPVAVTAGGGDG